MRLLVASDIHGTRNALELISRWQKEFVPDITILCGDITNFGPQKKIIKIIDSIEGNIMAVPGNCDPPGLEQGIEMSHGINLHEKQFRWKNSLATPNSLTTPTSLTTPNSLTASACLAAPTTPDNITSLTFAGVGGGLDVYDTPREYTEKEYGLKMKNIMPTDVLVLHCPPYGKNDLKGGTHGGSREIRRAIESHPPLLVLSGHIHESYGIMEEGQTIFINPGSARDGRIATLEIDENNKMVRRESIRLMKH